MKRRGAGRGWGLLGVVGLLLAATAASAEQTVLEEVLDILREDGRISESQYRDLLARHRAELEQAALPAVSSAREPDPQGWTARWKNGLRVERNDGHHKLKLGGRIQNDWALIHQGGGLVNKSDGNWLAGTEFRRARLFVSGTLFDRLIFKAQYDFADDPTEFKDVYVGLTRLGPVDRVQVGHFKVPFGLEELTSSKYITFMERSLVNVVGEERDTGVSVHDAPFDERMTWTLAGFAITDDLGMNDASRGDYLLAARATGLPFYEAEGEKLVHLGFGYAHGFRENATIDLAQRPEMHLADELLDTGDIMGVTAVDRFGPEFAWVCGPFSLQGEFKGALLQRNQGMGDLWFWGAYGEASWFLTGEHRVYDTGVGYFDRVTPIRSFDPGEGHWGAFQVAARYSHVDLSDGDVSGGREDDMTLGLNWHLFSNARISLNYVWGRVRGQGNVTGAQTRFQLDF